LDEKQEHRDEDRRLKSFDEMYREKIEAEIREKEMA